MKPERQENRKRDGSNNNKTNVFGNLDTVLATVCINFDSKRESLTYNKKIFIVVTHSYPTEGQLVLRYKSFYNTSRNTQNYIK